MQTILETFEYFCQISSKSITIILSYTVSKLVHLWRHSVVISSSVKAVFNVYTLKLVWQRSWKL